MKMPGHLGQVQRTTQNLEVIQVREADNILLIKGSIPGAEGDYDSDVARPSFGGFQVLT